ncbi:MAG: hypothetical protein DRQ78_05925 [Epsilonproteobacteria bacterium]|nr:MAG: hypothetical protein DRQ78_05925 [Campylobacterota bacterium]
MISFKQYLTEADYMRFLKKNKNLTDDQKGKLNLFFKSDKKAANRYEKKWGWQSDVPQKMNWADFEDIMSMYNSGRRINLKSIKIPGKKGEDYWTMRIKSKSYVANIPLNRSTATYMNSCKYGNLLVNYCVGWADDSQYWNDHVIEEQKVPIYVIDGRKKWVVMIKEGNKKYEVWDKMNDRDVSIGNPEPIPNFSIKKELLGSRQSKLYEEIRLEFYSDKDYENDHSENGEHSFYDDFKDNIDEIERHGNNLHYNDLEDGSDGADLLIVLSENVYIKNSDITITNDEIAIAGGVIVDWDDFEIDDTHISGSKIEGGEFDSVGTIMRCDIFGGSFETSHIDDCIIHKCEMDSCNVSKSSIESNHVTMVDTEINMTNIEYGKYEGCDISERVGKRDYSIGGGEFDNCSIYTNIGDGKFFNCNIVRYSSRSPVTNILGGDYLGCEIANANIYRSKFTECKIYDSSIKNSTLVRCDVDDETDMRDDVIIDNSKFDPLKVIKGEH